MTVSHSFSMAVVLSVLWSVAALESTEKAEGEVTAPNIGNLNLVLVLVITYSPRCARGTVKSTLCEFFSSSSCRCKIHAAFPLSLVNVKLFADRLIWFSAQYWCSACVLLDQQTKPNTIQNNTIQMITTYLSRVFQVCKHFNVVSQFHWMIWTIIFRFSGLRYTTRFYFGAFTVFVISAPFSAHFHHF